MVAEHALPPVARIGAVAWLARVALWPADATARRPCSICREWPCVATQIQTKAELEAGTLGWSRSVRRRVAGWDAQGVDTTLVAIGAAS